MCGIAGWIGKKQSEEHNRVIIQKMLEMIRHRGPDDRGMEIFPFGRDREMVMGHVRLSILDISKQGHQPMSDRNNDVTIVYNGEIYNAFDYVRELESDGVRLVSHTDTEVIIYLYLKYGMDGMLKRINGMFAFALYDRRTNTAYLVRDRMGVKPLYVYHTLDGLLYGSEIKCFLEHPSFKSQINESALEELFMYRFVAGKNTLFDGVSSVEAGHYFQIDQDLHISDHTYWDIPFDKGDELTIADYRDSIRQSVQDRLLSDVKLGIQLSGGIDSSLVLYYASNDSKTRLETYSIIFENEAYSEKKWMDIAAARSAAVQHQEYLDVNKMIDAMETVTWHMDAPIAMPNNIGVYWMCKTANEQGVKVLLTGEGADEVFGGYLGDAKTMYASLHPIIQSTYENIRQLSGRERNYVGKAKEHYLYSDAVMNQKEISAILEDAVPRKAIENRREIFDKYIGARTREDQYLDYKVRTYLIELCMRQDRMGMASSVETRVPFCNYRLLEMARSQEIDTYIQPSLRPSGRGNKMPLKRISETIFGEDFTYRTKSGFPLPISEYYQSERFSNFIEKEVLPWLLDCRYLKKSRIKDIWQNRMQLTGLACEKIWIILGFGIWGKEFVG